MQYRRGAWHGRDPVVSVRRIYPCKTEEQRTLARLAKAGSVRVLIKSNVLEIGKDVVSIDHDGKRVTLPNDDVIVCAGGILPTSFLREIGIDVETKFGTA